MLGRRRSLPPVAVVFPTCGSLPVALAIFCEERVSEYNFLKYYKMSRVAYNRQDLLNQTNVKNLKSEVLAPGTTLKITAVRKDTLKRGDKEELNHQLICSTEKGNILVSVREYTRMKIEAGKAYDGEEGTEEIYFPEAFSIVTSVDRKDRDGDVIFPVFAYAKGQEFLDSNGSMTWTELKEGGMVDDIERFSAVQDYTIAVL